MAISLFLANVKLRINRMKPQPDSESETVVKGHGRIETRNFKVYDQI